MKSTLTLSLAHFGRRMHLRRGRRAMMLSVILTALIVAGLSAALRVSQAQSGGQNPDYSQVNDVLYGGTHLLRNDDLVMTFTYQTAANEFREVLLTAGTQDSNASVLRFDHSVNIPNGQAGCSTSGGCYLDFHYYDFLKFATGRFFDTDRDTTVLYPFHFVESQTPLLLSLAGQSVPPSAANLALTTAQDVSFVIGGTLFLSAVADFNRDGYDDLLMAWSSNVVGSPRMAIATAVDVTHPELGFRFGPVFTPAAPFGIRQVTVGDFTGDGQPDIVQAYIDPSRLLTLATYSVDPATLTIAEGAQLGYLQAADTGYHPVELAAGHFTALDHHQLVVGAQLADGDQVHMGFFDFAPNSIQPQRVSSVFFPDAATGVTLRLKAARFIWSNPYDQIAWMSSSVQGGGTRLSVLIVDPQSQTVVRKADVLPVPDIPGQGGVTILGYDIAVGNFDNRQRGPGTSQTRDPDLQIALIAARRNNQNGQTGTGTLYLYSVSQDSATLTNTAGIVLVEDFFGGNMILNMSIAAGDLQGRSYRLGRGTKITIEDYAQPSAITAMPPMHVDFVIPSGATAPTVLNLSAVPDSFNTKYVIEVEQNTDTTQTDTVSHSFGFKESIGASFEVGDYDEGEGLKVEDTVTATQDIKHSNETVQGTFEGRNETIGITTGWGDSVSYSSTTFNFWVYEVIGQKVCPQGEGTSCPNPKPLTVQFSAPSMTADTSLVGPNIEWYQPLWEPGNVFSYPANFAQLQQSVGALDKLTQDRTYFTDSQSVEQNTTWRSGVSASTTIGTDKTFSGDNTLSVAGKAGIGDVFTVGGEVSFEAYGSDAFSNNTQTHGASNQSTGITFTKPGTFAEQSLYAYAFTPYIFGTLQPPNFVDTVDLTTQVTTFGPLRSAFVADPTHPGSGGWWSQTYTRPDVALNHPARWAVSQAQVPAPPTPIPLNCLVFGSDSSKMDCVTLNQATPTNPWSSAVHFMRGFFISSELKPGAGPQRTMALEGEQLRLQARVYNYSLAPMAGQVHVRFYGVPWNQSTHSPAGNAFLIGEDVPGPIPPFDASSTAPNWVLARTTWDTTNLGNQYFTFFVLAWIQHTDGSLGQEMLGHGLSGLPGTLTSFSDAAQLEEIVSGHTVSYSNNLGFYNHAFYVIPQSNSATLAQTQPAPGDVRLERIELAQPQVAAGQSLEVAAHLRTHTQSASGVSVVFYDGDPQNGGRAFDEERIAHIRPNDTAQARVLFRSDVCGAHRIYVTVGQGEPYEVTDASHPVQVPCD
jgi:hypothetical protein